MEVDQGHCLRLASAGDGNGNLAAPRVPASRPDAPSTVWPITTKPSAWNWRLASTSWGVLVLEAGRDAGSVVDQIARRRASSWRINVEGRSGARAS
jgi:hypothetical protein